MKNFFKLTKAFAVHALIFSLMQTTFIFGVQAASIDKTEATGKEILSVANIAVQTYGQFLGAKQQMISQQIAATKNQAMMQQLSPGCRKPDGTACYTVAGKFFPECPIPASMSSMPQNVCSAASPDPAAISSMITYESISKSWVNYFEQMQNPASNSTTPFGMKCLEDKKKALDSQLTEMQNNLTRLQDQLNKDKETFKANNKKLIDDMTATNDELNGSANGSGKNNLKAKTTDFAKYFSQSCQSVIGDEALAAGAQSLGFIGIMQSMSATNKKAADYNSNRTLIEADVRRDIEKNKKLIVDGGIDDYLSATVKGGGLQSTTKYGSVAAAIVKQADEFSTAKARIAKELSKIGYTLPPIDKNFSADFDGFLAGSQEFFKKQYVNDCVTGADKSGTAISTDQILSSLKQKSTNSEGTARDKYKAALKTILDSDAFIEDKLSQIKALETNYKDITITYQNSNAQRVTITPYDLYMKTLTACQSRYGQDQTFSTSASGVSQKTKVARGQALLRELKSLSDNYTSQLGSRVLEQALNCNGETKKSGSGCSVKDGGTAFDTANVNFCMSQASQCANEIAGCFSEADKQVQTRKAKLEAQAKTFNANTAALVARSNALYTAQKNAVMDMVKVVQARFPGTNFPIPADMFITMPEMKKDTFGVDMANDGNLAFMDELPKKIDLLKKVFKDQQVAVDKEIDDYVGKQSDAMSREKDKWEKLAGECKNMIDTSSREIAKMNNENMKKQSDMDNKVKNFCRKYASLANHPVGGCDNAKSLSSTMDEVASRIVPTVATNIAEFNGTCNEYNNESSSASQDCDSVDDKDMGKGQLAKCNAIRKAEAAKIEAATAAANKDGKKTAAAPKKSKKGMITPKAICSDKDGKALKDADFIEKAIAKLPEKERNKMDTADRKKALAKAVLKNDFSDFDYNIKDGDFFGDIAAISEAGKSGNSICQSVLDAEKYTPKSADKEKTDLYNAAVKDRDKFNTDNKAVTERSAEQVGKDSKELEDLKKVLPDKITAEQSARILELKKINDTADAFKGLNDKVAATQKAMDESAKETDPKGADNKASLLLALDNLKEAGSATPSVTEVKSDAFRKIGEQVEENTTCDSQATNTNVAKAFQNSLLPAGFDEKVLGIAK
ncbi:MAG: hypothetical protein H7177_05290 [Rhizobacter sp.]|nr:hypothetical protein [Bacteriovorax sp.]